MLINQPQEEDNIIDITTFSHTFLKLLCLLIYGARQFLIKNNLREVFLVVKNPDKMANFINSKLSENRV